MTTTSPTTTLTIDGRNAFDDAVRAATGQDLHAASLQTFQVNIGLTCNLACHHCHVESSPKREEQMSRETMQLILDAASQAGATTLDITGGAPEMNPDFRWFVQMAVARNLHVIVRTNLTIMLQPGYTNLPDFYRDHGVHLVASLPCYLEENVNKQRGLRVYEESIDVIQKLNAVGYGHTLTLDLVYNPLGPSLPPDTASLEADYKRILDDQFNIRFNNLITITNMPIGRFQHDLARDGRAHEYAALLQQSFNADTVAPLMCRHQVHIAHDGSLHDCDFNYALGLTTQPTAAQHIKDFNPATHINRRVTTADHCFGCTAGAGSSCGGALA